MIAKAGLAAAAIAIVSLVVSLALPDARRTVVFSDRVSPESLSRWSAIHSAGFGRVSVAPNPLGDGQVLRFEVRNGDRGFAGDQRARAQVIWWEQLARDGDENRYSWSTYVPREYPLSARPQDLLELKNQGAGPPPLSVGLRAGCMTLDAGPQAGDRRLWAGRLRRGRWVDLELAVRWSPKARDGRVVLRYQGRIVTVQRLATMYPGRANYVKLGLARDPATRRTGVVFARDIRIESLLPGSSAGEQVTAARAPVTHCR